MYVKAIFNFMCMYVTDLASALGMLGECLWTVWQIYIRLQQVQQRDAEFRRLNRACITAFKQAINTFCEKSKVRNDIKFQALSKAQASPLKGLYFDGRKI